MQSQQLKYQSNILVSQGCKMYLLLTLSTIKKLKVQTCKLYNNKYMITSTQITNTEIFVSIAVLVFKLLSHKVLFINKKDKRNC